MAALNKKCFEKGCICASCKNICSRCLISDNTCEHGVKACGHKVFKPYDKFIEEHAEIKIADRITRSDYFNTYNKGEYVQ
ncbi:MAG: hypothetical protein J6A59_01560 [Lachnospiraceae bacterium]|nr:hypothetical protein [Lachnospiraceae bacterium]